MGLHHGKIAGIPKIRLWAKPPQLGDQFAIEIDLQKAVNGSAADDDGKSLARGCL
jgi:hypothetical protein